MVHFNKILIFFFIAVVLFFNVNSSCFAKLYMIEGSGNHFWIQQHNKHKI